MTATLGDLIQLKQKAFEDLQNLPLEDWRIKYIGRKGAVPLLLRDVKDLPESDRKNIGQAANELRRELEKLYKQKKQEFKPDLKIENWDLKIAPSGHLHPLTTTIRRIQDILAALGFFIAEGPEVEEEKYNFDLLNIPLEHTARGIMDTFHIASEEKLVLRTHTSPVQLRAVLENNLTPPFRVASPGRVFRAERTDATHESTFYQFEGLVVGEEVTIADFKGLIETFYSSFFSRQVKIRLRPSYFPFVEPGFEVDITCPFCNDGCRVCKYTRWLEIMGAGMVHPSVLQNMNVDAGKYQGYAFGGAVDRLAMLWHGIDDIRLLWSGDIRFLKQF